MKSYWDELNNFKHYDRLLLDKPVQLQKAEFDGKNNLIYKTEETILFYDAERTLLIIGFICLVFIVGVIV